MKFLSILLLILPCLVKNQNINSTQQKNKSNIYNDAIKRYITYNIKSIGFPYDSHDTLYVQRNENFTDSLLSSIQNLEIKVLDWPDVENKLTRDSSFTLHKFFPLKFDEGSFYISVVPFRTTKDSSGINLGNGGGCRMRYSFNSQTKKFSFLKVMCWGI